MLVVLFDDTGLAAWSPYGGRVNMPTLQRLADNGLTYSQWHTTALCSPTRSMFLHRPQPPPERLRLDLRDVDRFPGTTRTSRARTRPMATVLRDAGWSTFWVGKNHNIPVDVWTMGSSKKGWPLALGYDRFYGFVGGETNQWYPDLAEDNHYVDQPYGPEDGYHLSKDLADKALEFIRDSKQSEPNKPWYLWFCPGANHAPHHAPQEYIDKYKGVFDDGYEAYREWVLPRMIEKGHPSRGDRAHAHQSDDAGHVHPGDSVRPWDELDDDEKRLFSRMAEVYAGDVGVRRRAGRSHHRLPRGIRASSTTRSSSTAPTTAPPGEGSPNGSVNENKFFNAWPDTIEDNLALIDQLGGPDTYNHYPTGWAVAFSTPFRMFKRYSYQGGVCDPLVISLARGDEGEAVRCASQYHHCTDIVPTILDCCGVKMPKVVDGVRADAAARGVDALLVRRRRRADEEEGPVLRDARHARHLARRLEGRDRARPRSDQPREVRPGPLAAVPHRRRPFGSARRRRRAPRASVKELTDLWLAGSRRSTTSSR